MRIKLTTWLAVLLVLACLPLARAQERSAIRARGSIGTGRGSGGGPSSSSTCSASRPYRTG